MPCAGRPTLSIGFCNFLALGNSNLECSSNDGAWVVGDPNSGWLALKRVGSVLDDVKDLLSHTETLDQETMLHIGRPFSIVKIHERVQEEEDR